LTAKLREEVRRLLLDGTVIPAHPLALNSSRRLDVKHQRALTRYYVEAGAGGVAVGVHMTQFSIREKGMLEPVLRLASETIADLQPRRPIVKVAGVCGETNQAVAEANLAKDLGYDLALVSPVGTESWSEDRLLERAEQISQILPVFGFYLQPSVGGRELSFEFWRRLADLPGVAAIKAAPFNRYKTVSVLRAVAYSKRRDEIAVYTGNDDNIVADLLTPYDFTVDGRRVRKWISGGLLGQWAVWSKSAVSLLEQIKKARSDTRKNIATTTNLLGMGNKLTDANAAIFDAANCFRGLLAGVNEVLRRQALLENRFTLEPDEDITLQQMREIDRVLLDYPELHVLDDDFIRLHLSEWLES
jgi:hypothetical protein